MNITLKIHYWIDPKVQDYRLPPGGRFEEEVDIEMREMSSDEMPYGLRWNGGATRVLDGRHYMPQSLGDPLTAAADWFTDMNDVVVYMTSPHDGGTSRLLEGYVELQTSGRPKRFDPSKHACYATDDNRMAAHDGARDFERDFLFVDGKLWLACPEPALLVTEQGVEVILREAVPSKFMRGRVYQKTADCSVAARTFRFDCQDAARSFAAASGRDLPARGDLVVYEQRSVTRDDAREAVIECALALLDHYRHRSVGEFEPAIASGLAGISALTWKRPPHEIDCEALFERVEACALSMVIHEGATVTGLEAALNRWRERDIALDEALAAPNAAYGR